MLSLKWEKPATMSLLLLALVVCVGGVTLAASRFSLNPQAFGEDDRIVALQGVSVKSEAHREFLLRRLERAAPCSVKIERTRERVEYRANFAGDELQIAPVPIREEVQTTVVADLVKRFSATHLAGALLASAAFLASAFFALRKSGDSAFSLAMACVGAMIASGEARFSESPVSLAVGIHFAFLASFALAPAFFWRWSLRFPKSIASLSVAQWALSLAPFAIGIALSLVALHRFQNALAEPTREAFQAYQAALNWIRAFFATLVCLSLATLIRTFRRSKRESDLRQLRWAIVGASVPAIPFVLLSLFPKMLVDRALLSDETAVGLALFAPTMMTIGVTRCQLLNLDKLFSRAFVLLSALLLLGLIHAVAFFLLSQLFSTSESLHVVVGLSLLPTLLLYEPIQSFVKRIVVAFHFDAEAKAQKVEGEIMKTIQVANDEEHLAEILAKKLKQVFQVSSVAIAFRSGNDGKIKIVAQSGLESDAANVSFPSSSFSVFLCARSEQLEEGVPRIALNETMSALGWIALAVPILDEPAPKRTTTLIGYILLGEKKSGIPFSAEEARLLESVARSSARTLSRLRLQRSLFIEREEAKKLRELSEMQKLFLRGVSHDLRTPLAVIRLFAENLSERIEDETAKDRLKRIAAEATRLAEMVGNILAYARDEQDAENNRFATLNLSDLARDVISSLNDQLEINQFEVKMAFAAEPLFVNGNAETLKMAIRNLVSNAMKYSGQSKTIEIATRREDKVAILSVKDCGIGIPAEEQEKIFNPFYRSPRKETQVVGGMGLGLALVKKIADFHDATISVKSEVGKGTEFEMRFSIKDSVDNDEAKPAKTLKAKTQKPARGSRAAKRQDA